jgi:hypothetical protein
MIEYYTYFIQRKGPKRRRRMRSSSFPTISRLFPFNF